MIKAKIFGAGSIGNHLTKASRSAGWEVTVVDNNPEALRRMKEEIYPKRYGQWDDTIEQFTADKAPVGGFDVIFIGTPPDSHLQIAAKVLNEEAPKVLQIEKPICSPTLEGLDEFMEARKNNPQTAIIVGFNHVVADNTKKAEEFLGDKELGELLSIDCEVRSHWKNIFKAHPWLDGPHDTYLGHWKRGGGAGGEHSHALNLWQHFAHILGAGRVKEVNASFDYVEKDGALYDQSCFINLTTENGLIGRVAQDVVRMPKSKFSHIQFSKGYVQWHNDVSKTLDQIFLQKDGQEKLVIDIIKDRKEEFLKEILHIKKIIDGEININESPIRLERGLDTILVLAAAHKSHKEKRTVPVDYSIYQ